MESKLKVIAFMTAIKKEEELVNDLINSLIEYRDSDFKGNKPVAENIMLSMKWQQGDSSIEEVISDIDESSDIIEMAHEIKNAIDDSSGEEGVSVKITAKKVSKEEFERKMTEEEGGSSSKGVKFSSGEGGNA